MLSSNDGDLLTKGTVKKLRVNKHFTKNDFECLGGIQTKGKASLDVNNDVQESNSVNFRDDGYLSLATCEAKTSKHLLLVPTNSWPMRRKVTEKELKEFGEKLDSGSTSLVENNGNNGRNSKYSVSSHTGTLLIEQEPALIRPDPESCNSSIEKCIDYCTCMFCVKSACYIFDDQDDTGTPHYNPCYCSEPSKGCISRWSLLGLLTCFLPCLMCYPLARGCLVRHNRCKSKKYAKSKSKLHRYRIKFSKSKQEQEPS